MNIYIMIIISQNKYARTHYNNNTLQKCALYKYKQIIWTASK